MPLPTSAIRDLPAGRVILATTNDEQRVYQRLEDGEDDRWQRIGNPHSFTTEDIIQWADGYMELIPGPPPGPHYPPIPPGQQPWG